MRKGKNYNFEKLPENFITLERIEGGIIDMFRDNPQHENFFKLTHIGEFTGLILTENVACLMHYCVKTDVAQLALADPKKITEYKEPPTVLKIDTNGIHQFFNPGQAHPEIIQACNFIKQHLQITA